MNVFKIATILVTTAAATSNPWQSSIDILQTGIDNHVFPGAVALVGNKNGTLLRVAVGNLTYDSVPTPMGQVNLSTTLDTIFDMASCSKVTATTTAVALLFGNDANVLDTSISQYLPGYEQQNKGPITIRNCLLHNAALPPDPTPNYWDPKFGCEDSPLPSIENFKCSEKIYNSLLSQTLRPNATIGGAYVYSDLSFITLMYVVGTVAMERGLVTSTDFLPQCTEALSRINKDHATDLDINTLGLSKQCAFEAYVRLHVFKTLGMSNTGYLPPQKEWSKCQPTWIPDGEPGMRGHALQGQVEDGNCYNMGGIAGHAGVFSTVNDLESLMRMWMQFDASKKGQDGQGLLNHETIELFTTINNHSQSSRALGWNTNDITAQPDGGWDLSCGNLSKETFTHVGFTGTQLCGDPVLGVYTILLTARVYGSPNTENSTGIHAVRKSFGSAVAKVIRDGPRLMASLLSNVLLSSAEGKQASVDHVSTVVPAWDPSSLGCGTDITIGRGHVNNGPVTSQPANAPISATINTNTRQLIVTAPLGIIYAVRLFGGCRIDTPASDQFAKTKNCGSQVYTVNGTREGRGYRFYVDLGTPGEPLTFATLVWTAAPWSDFLRWNGPGVYAVNATMSIFGASASSNQ